MTLLPPMLSSPPGVLGLVEAPVQRLVGGLWGKLGNLRLRP